MFGALAAVIGPPAVGKTLNSLLGLVDRIGEAKERKDILKHERAMAESEAGLAYLKAQHEQRNGDGDESLLSRTMCWLYRLFGATMCAFILLCVLLQFEVIPYGADYALPFKDPDEKGKSLSIFGLILFKWGAGKIQYISPLGYAYLGYSSISFIITLTLTNRRRFR